MTFLFWAAAIVVFAIAEAATTALVSIWFAVGAAAAMVASIFTASLGAQCAVFAVVSAAALAATRPLVRRMTAGKAVATNADRVIGQHGVVTQAIDNEMAEGQVRVSGQIWTARSSNDNIRIPCGTLVTVQQISGVKLIVDPANEEKECNV